MSIDHSMTLRLFVGLLCSIISAFASELYSTDFSDFPVGEDQLVGYDGWEGTNIGQGVHGIDAEAIAGIGQSAYLGAAPPSLGTEAVSVFRPLASPVTSEAVVEFQTVFGIAASTQGGEDIFTFTFTFYNADDDYLAAIQFDTALLDYGIWQDDGSSGEINRSPHAALRDHALDAIASFCAFKDLVCQVWIQGLVCHTPNEAAYLGIIVFLWLAHYETRFGPIKYASGCRVFVQSFLILSECEEGYHFIDWSGSGFPSPRCFLSPLRKRFGFNGRQDSAMTRAKR